MIVSIVVLICIGIPSLICTYFGFWTIEYRNVIYKIQFNENDEMFGNVTIGKTYYCWRNAYYHRWKRSEVFHYLDDDGVNQYINIYDPILEKCTFVIKTTDA